MLGLCLISFTTHIFFLHAVLGGNTFDGPIPTQFGDLLNLEEIDVEGASLNGRIPSQLGQLTKLIQLTLDWNDLTGDVPGELGALTNLGQLHLEGNDLNGDLDPIFCTNDFDWDEGAWADCSSGNVECSCCDVCF